MRRKNYVDYLILKYIYTILSCNVVGKKEYFELRNYFADYDLLQNNKHFLVCCEEEIPQDKRYAFFKKNYPLFLKEIEKKIKTAPKNMPQSLIKNAHFLSHILCLSALEKEILNILTLYISSDFFRDICSVFYKSRNLKMSTLSKILNMPKYDLTCLFSKNCRLIDIGLFVIKDEEILFCDKVLNDIFERLFANEDDFYTYLLGEKLFSKLSLNNFSYLPEKDILLKFLTSVAKKKERGINILFYGNPGTGKTEFAKTLASQAGLNLYQVLDEKSAPRMIIKSNRLTKANFVQKLLFKNNQSCILIDEADDVLYTPIFREPVYSKLEINKTLENNTTPIIWIINKISGIDQAYLRRFSYAVHFEEPDQNSRKQIWTHILSEHKICDENVAHKFSKKYTLPPSFVSNAVNVARHTKGGISDIEEQLNSMEKLMNNGTFLKKEAPITAHFNPDLLNTDVDLDFLCQRIIQTQNTNFSLCLYGASGTGKSAYARYLADKMGLEVIHKKVSDLSSMWVGQTEKNIAKAFMQAEKNKALLIFDEADSFLQDRTRATRSWEISQVNEMLTWMENHPYPFICTTNLIDNMDKASLRRFSFKVKYNFLTSNQVKLACRHFFNLNFDNVDALTSLSPGDFAVVKKKADFLNCASDNAKIYNFLLEEQKIKNTSSLGKIGFL